MSDSKRYVEVTNEALLPHTNLEKPSLLEEAQLDGFSPPFKSFTSAECRLINLYWQVEPNPGTFAEALGQLAILEALNIFTDILLIVLPMPAFLASLGIFLVIVTIIRLPVNFSDGLYQVNRTTWASVECFVAALVSNIPMLYTLRRNPKSNRHLWARNDIMLREGQQKRVPGAEGYERIPSSRKTFNHDLAVDKEYGISRVKPVSRFSGEWRMAEGNWPVSGPSRANDNGPY